VTFNAERSRAPQEHHQSNRDSGQRARGRRYAVSEPPYADAGRRLIVTWISIPRHERDPELGTQDFAVHPVLHKRQHPQSEQNEEGNLRCCAASTTIPNVNATPPDCELHSSVCNGH
jgi:hypothetical protein